LSDIAPGLLRELMVTAAGDLLGRCEFEVVVDRKPLSLDMPVFGEAWTVVDDADRARLAALADSMGLR
jgi:hypothetical protein